MTPRPDVSDERRKQILDAAARVFAQKGFHEARMDDVAGEASRPSGTSRLEAGATSKEAGGTPALHAKTPARWPASSRSREPD